MMPPGSRLLAFASRWFNEPTVASVFQPLIADWQHEWSSAPAGRRLAIAWRGRLAFIVTIVATYPRVLLVPSPPGVARAVLIRLAVGSAIVFPVGMISLLWPLAGQPWVANASPWQIAAIVLLPVVTVLTAFLPFALAAAITAIRGDKQLSPAAQRSAVVKSLIATTIWMIVGAGWIVPPTEQAWRSAVMTAASGEINYVPPRGMRELSTYELVFHPDRAFVQHNRPGVSTAREIVRRAALVLLPFVLVGLSWRTFHILAPRSHWTSVLTGMATSLALWSLPLAPNFMMWFGQLTIGLLLIPTFQVVHHLRTLTPDEIRSAMLPRISAR